MSTSGEGFDYRLASESGLAAARRLPAAVARRYGVVPVAVADDTLVVAASRHDVGELTAVAEALTGLRLHVVVVTPEEVAAAQRRAYGELPVLRGRRFLPGSPPPPRDRAFLRRLAENAGLEFVELADPDREVDRTAARLLGEQTSRWLGVVALSVEASAIRVATTQPFDRRALAVVESVTARDVRPVVAAPDRIAAAVEVAFSAEATEPAAEDSLAAPGRRLGELLVAAGALDPATLAHALDIQRRSGERLGRVLLAHRHIGHERLAQTLAEQLRLPYVTGAELRPRRNAIDLLPEAVCRAHRVLPLGVVGEELVVATSDPFDEEAAQAVRAASGRPVRIVVGADDRIGAELVRLFAGRRVEIATTELVRRRPEESAHTVLTGRQKAVLVALAAAAAAALAAATVPALIALVVLATAFYLASSIYKFVLVFRTIGHEPEISVSPTEVSLLDERTLPRYTILVPLYHEAVVTSQLIGALDRLDYPAAKLDVKLLLEEDDVATRDAVRAVELGPQYDLVIVPYSQPQTKPKACNYGLLHARGEYVVIYDAEDIPEPDQLKKAVIAFRKAAPGVVCVQAKLNYWNREQNLMTRWFTSEYSMWFDLFLPGLDATGAPIPLGGTSNHFPVETLLELGAWDPFNVTEDADVGIRLARSGYRTAMVESTTYEEANSRVYNWIRQRSRWMKGYVQTWLVHMRQPARLWRDLGPADFASFQLVLGGTPLTALLNPIFWALTSLWALTEAGLIREIFPGPVYFAGALNLLVGNFVFAYLNVLGAFRRGYDELVKYALFSPVYWALMSVGAWKGVLQLFTRPSFWEKTIHGLARPG